MTHKLKKLKWKAKSKDYMHLQRKLTGKLLLLSKEAFLKKIKSFIVLYNGNELGSCSGYARVEPLEIDP